MSAINTLITGLCTSGDKMICAHDLYGGSSDLFHLNISRAGIQVYEYDFSDIEGLEKKIEQTSPTILYLESPSNPVLRVYDIKALAEIAKKYDCYLIVDNTFNTSLIQKPIDWGADFVIYSTTKYLNGHGNALGGAILSQHHDLMDDRLLKTMRLNGSTISPMDAWLLGQGIKTLPLRYKAQQHNAQLLADFLNELSQVSKVYYPGLTMHANHDLAKEQMNGFGAMLSFELKENVDRFLRSLRLVTLAPTLGDINSLVLHPATMSHRNMPEKQRLELGITDQLIRLSVGIEHIDDLKSDILEALKA
jgi:cystathionine beta-lyase/cystathionine gamma-synthase